MKEEKGYPLDKDNPAKSSPQERRKTPGQRFQERRQKKQLRSRRWGMAIAVLEGLVSAVFLGLLLMVDVLPLKYGAIAAAACVLLFAVTYLTQKRQKIRIVGKVVGIFASIVLATGIYGLIVADQALDSVIGDGAEPAAVSVTQDVFHVFVYGNGACRIVTVNPKERQILVVTTPEAYYVTIRGVSEGKKDLLKNAEKYGMKAMMDTLGLLYETEIPFYVTMEASDPRELLKTFTPDMAVRPDKLIKTIDETVETNLSRRQLQLLWKLYLKENDGWEILSVDAKGKNSSNYTYSDPDKVSFVLEPDQESVKKIIDLFNRMEAGERLKKADVKS